MIWEKSAYQCLGELWQSYLKAKREKVIPENTKYLPAVGSVGAPVRYFVYCQNENGEPLPGVSSVDVFVSDDEEYHDRDVLHLEQAVLSQKAEVQRWIESRKAQLKDEIATIERREDLYFTIKVVLAAALVFLAWKPQILVTFINQIESLF